MTRRFIVEREAVARMSDVGDAGMRRVVIEAGPSWRERLADLA